MEKHNKYLHWMMP